MKKLAFNRKELNTIFNQSYQGKTVNIFVSYSSLNGDLAGKIKYFLEKYGLSVFLAHEDIRPTADWQKEIIKNLKACDIFLPLLTSKFRESEWTDQEIGMAIILDKLVLPAKASRNPHGFIGLRQACNFDYRDVKQSCRKIIRVIREHNSFRQPLSDCLIRTLETSRDFDGARDILIELKEIENFAKKQLDQILRISIKNNQVRMCTEGQDFLKAIVKKYASELDPILLDVYERVKDTFQSPVST